MSLLAGISQASQCEVIINAVDPSFNDFEIHLPFICRWWVQFDGMWDNLGRQSSTKGYIGSYGLGRTGHSHHKKKYVRKIQIENNLIKLSLVKGSHLFKRKIEEQQS